MLMAKFWAVALALSLQGCVPVWCMTCGEMIGTHEYAACICEDVCTCECEECEARPAHLKDDHMR